MNGNGRDRLLAGLAGAVAASAVALFVLAECETCHQNTRAGQLRRTTSFARENNISASVCVEHSFGCFHECTGLTKQGYPVRWFCRSTDECEVNP
jgi:hypothetical protein